MSELLVGMLRLVLILELLLTSLVGFFTLIGFVFPASFLVFKLKSTCATALFLIDRVTFAKRILWYYVITFLCPITESLLVLLKTTISFVFFSTIILFALILILYIRITLVPCIIRMASIIILDIVYLSKNLILSVFNCLFI